MGQYWHNRLFLRAFPGGLHDPYSNATTEALSSEWVLAKVLEMPEPTFIDQVIAQVAVLGQVNHVVNPI